MTQHNLEWGIFTLSTTHFPPQCYQTRQTHEELGWGCFEVGFLLADTEGRRYTLTLRLDPLDVPTVRFKNCGAHALNHSIKFHPLPFNVIQSSHSDLYFQFPDRLNPNPAGLQGSLWTGPLVSLDLKDLWPACSNREQLAVRQRESSFTWTVVSYSSNSSFSYTVNIHSLNSIAACRKTKGEHFYIDSKHSHSQF